MSKCKTEYITKEQAQVTVSRSLQFNGLECPDVYREIDAIPPADVVEVTRCKDCVKNEKCMLYSDYRFPFFENDFCSYGWDGEE